MSDQYQTLVSATINPLKVFNMYCCRAEIWSEFLTEEKLFLYRVSLLDQGSNFLFFPLWLYSLFKKTTAASEEIICFLLARGPEILLNTSKVKEENVFILAK